MQIAGDQSRHVPPSDVTVPGGPPQPDTRPQGQRHGPFGLAEPDLSVVGDARAESAKQVAAAVGEGAMSVMLVHHYLEKL